MDTSGPSTPPDGSVSQSKRRRQVAFYPNMNATNKPQKPFSRSAAKRESVMALGSIEYLQHYFTKTGIAAESDPLQKPNSGLRPAIGGLQTLQNRLSVAPDFVLPPSPAMPTAPRITFPPYVKTFETDPENLRPGVIEDLITVASGWNLDPQKQASTEQDPNLLGVGGGSRNSIDILDLLKNTTRAVRSVRNYLVSLPDDAQAPQNKPHFRPHTLSSSPLPKRQVSQPNSPHDPLTRIRGRALEVLAVLRELEERARLPLDHDAYDAQSDHGSSNDANTAPLSRGTSPSSQIEDADFLDADTSVSISYVDVGGRQRQVPVWEDEESSYDVNSVREEDKRDRWDERLVLGGGWLYQQNLRMEDLARERDVVSRYLDAVDDVLFGGAKEGKRGWEREKERVERKERADREARAKGRRVSAGDASGHSGEGSARANRRVVSTSMLDSFRGMTVTEEPEEMESLQEEDLIEDDDLPAWAKRTTFIGDDFGRLVALLAALLPGDLLRLLPTDPDEHASILRVLSSGQLLCTAYNAGVRKSRKPWGYVDRDAIHDIAALELAQAVEGSTEAKRGWTFRRTDNLRLWAAALKLRYSLPIVLPGNKRPKEGTPISGGSRTPADGNTPLPSPSVSAVSFPATITEDTILFDAPLVARLEDGWEHALERLVFKWMDAVVSEKRGER
ncbi:uncharacterized protein TRAVEDRAFT_155506 [Trametes versicolor FP-101664 SS1]|uniref:uncharacterized protein n=1 Tax=Trametes versicolor (strain FP-101664) TaxID=717944 RepID=UPI000462375C|nr:uncharacterized protein TRAVEDRAFT_155506 [Trametes versicolor FP-101664 SS1]EIW52733.1 hypothetical protein TRAVEDRAFT_155506 [Trametes versicolor FP-101664 SS1]